MNDDCQRYLEDPESNAAHLDSCASCRAMDEELSSSAAHRPLSVDALPLAPWEGASHRSWPLVLGGLAVLIALAAGLFSLAGISPLTLLGQLPSMDVIASIARGGSAFMHNAPTEWQIAIGAGFVAVNALLVFLLRRAPRGVDA